ncbi:MAG: circularly permuted type 2 ATP-grasp protein [Tepidisphaerales bacterium]
MSNRTGYYGHMAMDGPEAALQGPIARVLGGYRPQAGLIDEARAEDGAWRPHWRDIAARLDAVGVRELNQRWTQAQRMIRENGITYNVYGDPRGLDRPWELDPIPLVIPADDWSHLERGIIQRARLVEAMLGDVYGPQKLLEEGLASPAAVFNNPDFVRAGHGFAPAGGRRLHFYAAEIARGEDGRWRVLADKMHPLSGAGYALENRIVVSRALPELYRECRVHRLAGFFARAKDLFLRISPRQASDVRVVLLSPGPYDRSYFEQVYLSHYLGLTLTESADLTVREDAVYLKTLKGLYPVDVILGRLAEQQLDPLEFGGESSVGVPGLMRAVRAGRVAMANPVGAAVVEAREFREAMPALCRRLLGEELLLAGQEPKMLPTAPAWIDGAAVARAVVMRVYAVATPGGFDVMPGALTRGGLGRTPAEILSNRDQRSKDTWVLADGPVSDFSLIRPSTAPVPLIRGGYYLPSRVADNLFWLGRYAERAEGQLRLTRFFYSCLAEESDTLRLHELSSLLGTFQNFFDCKETIASLQVPEHLERTLLSMTFGKTHEGSLRNTVAWLEQAAWRVRDRLNPDTWRTITNLGTELDATPNPLPAGNVLTVLDRVLVPLEAFSGLIQESMTRGQGWHFLDLGRRVERATYKVELLRRTWGRATRHELTDLESVLSVAVSLMTYRSRYQTALQAAPAIDLLVCDETNPRSIAFQLVAMQHHVEAVADAGAKVVRGEYERIVLDALTRVRLADPHALARMDDSGGRPGLVDVLDKLGEALPAFSDALSRAFFAHGHGPTSLMDPGM